MCRPINFAIVIVLLLSLFFYDCATVSGKFAASQLHENGMLNKKLAHKKVEVHKRNDEFISGYFYEMKKDSLVIIPEKGSAIQIKIARQEIKFIRIIQDTHPEILVLILFVSISIAWYGIGLGHAIESAGH